jgi:hypothetical protein
VTIRRSLILALVVCLAPGCGASQPTVRERFDDARVEVAIHLERLADGPTVVAEFRPLDGGLHLYGASLPMDGIDGAGRPTRVELGDAGWVTAGPAQTSVTEVDVTLAGFDRPFPIYPDGPVVVRQPIQTSTGGDDGRIDLSVTFMACSSAGICFVPVVRHAMSLPSG